MSEFDALGELYEETFGLPWRRYLEVPTVFELLGDPTDRAMLDIGSGSGWYCRRLALLGAREVVGLELSSGMVAYARQHNSHPRIEYLLGNLPAELHGRFDTVISVYVFGYATTRAQLEKLCRTAAAALKPGGQFLVLTLNPDYREDPEYYAPYGFRIRSSHPRTDGAPATLEVQFGEHHETLDITYWTHEVLAGSLRHAGFSDPVDHDLRLAPEGTEKQGAKFWRDYLARPHVVVLDCRFPKTRASIGDIPDRSS